MTRLLRASLPLWLLLVLASPALAQISTIPPSSGNGGAAFDTSAELAAILTNETGSGHAVFADSPTLTDLFVGTEPRPTTFTQYSGYDGDNEISQQVLVQRTLTDLDDDYNDGAYGTFPAALVVLLSVENPEDDAGYNIPTAGLFQVRVPPGNNTYLDELRAVIASTWYGGGSDDGSVVIIGMDNSVDVTDGDVYEVEGFLSEIRISGDVTTQQAEAGLMLVRLNGTATLQEMSGLHVGEWAVQDTASVSNIFGVKVETPDIGADANVNNTAAYYAADQHDADVGVKNYFLWYPCTGGACGFSVDADGVIVSENLKTAGAATGKKVVCVDDNGKLYRSSSGENCAN